jgi:hypothetical protein
MIRHGGFGFILSKSGALLTVDLEPSAGLSPSERTHC